MSKKNKVTSYSSDSEEMIRMLKVLGTVIIIFVAFYFVFAVMNGEISFGKKKKAAAEIQNEEIIAGETYNRSEEEYYVLMYDFDSDEALKADALYQIHNAKSSTKMYLVDLSKKFSSKYITENTSDINVTDIEHLKVVSPILIKVENKKGVSYTVGYEEIEKVLVN